MSAESNGMVVLIVDDEPQVRMLLRTVFEVDGWEVHEAFDGQDALDKCADLQPDAIVMDIMMPRLDGLETCAALRADDRTADIPLVLLSAKASQQDIERGLAVGATEYIVKPFDALGLVDRVAELVAVGNAA